MRFEARELSEGAVSVDSSLLAEGEFYLAIGHCARTGTWDDEGHWVSVSDCR
jgi:hypothetical protein